MLELEVGISGFEGCVSFLGFPPRKPSWLRKPRTPRDRDGSSAADRAVQFPQPKLGPKPYRKRSLCYRARAPAGPAAHSLAQRRDGQQLPRFIMACGLRSNSILHLASHVSPQSTTTS
eukprot:COSAG04_NODE_5219_length_1697_cov_9.836045_2_plen_118_part_00